MYLTGSAFDYLARLHIARELHNTDVKVHERKWLAEDGKERLGLGRCLSRDDESYWHQTISEARLEYEAYISGSDNLGRVADLCQILERDPI